MTEEYPEPIGLKFCLKKLSHCCSISGKVARIVSARATSLAIRVCCRFSEFNSACGVRLAAAICQFTPAKTRSAATMMPRITRMMVLVLFDMVSASRVACVQCHDDFGATRFPQDLDIRKRMGTFESL